MIIDGWGARPGRRPGLGLEAWCQLDLLVPESNRNCNKSTDWGGSPVQWQWIVRWSFPEKKQMEDKRMGLTGFSHLLIIGKTKRYLHTFFQTAFRVT